jgi:tetratricopeptide (TPR) repeat protein
VPPAGVVAPTVPDSTGLGQGPLGRAGVLLDRTVAAGEAARARGEAVDQGMLANLRMTQQARDLIARGQTDRAADLLERAIAIDDGAGYAYLYLAYIHLGAGRRDQAEVFLARAETSLPNDPALRVELNQLRARADAAVVDDTRSP